MPPLRGGGDASRDQKLSFFAERCRGKKVLDLGCVHHNPANARSAFWLHGRLAAVTDRLTGLDLYEDGVRVLRDQGYNVVHGDAQNFDLGETFDVICGGDIIEHVANPGHLLASAKRHLEPEGVLLLSTPNPWYWRFLVRAVLSGGVVPNPEHVSWFCRYTITTLLRREGFTVESIDVGSRRTSDHWLPLPRFVRFNTLFVEARICPGSPGVVDAGAVSPGSSNEA